MATQYLWIYFLFALHFADVIALSENKSGHNLKKCNFYVTPSVQNPQSQDTKCPTKQESKCTECRTLDYYAENQDLFECNCTVTVIFLEGDHVLSDKSLYINQVHNLTMIPKSEGNVTVTVVLNNSNVTLKSVSILSVERLVFQGKTSTMHFEPRMYAKLWKVELRSIAATFTSPDSHTIITMVNKKYPKSTFIEISESYFHSSNILFMFEAMPDDGQMAINLSIKHSRFFGQSFDVCSVNMPFFALAVHNIVVKSPPSEVSSQSHYNIIDLPSCSHIKPSTYEKHDIMLEISAAINQTSEAIINVTKSRFNAPIDNVSISGIHIHLHGHLSSARISITDSTISGYQEGGLHMYIGTVTLTDLHITVEKVSITDCSSNSSLSYSSAMSIVGDYYSITAIHVKVCNCNFIRNQDLHGDSITLWLYNIKEHVLIEDCVFDSNLGTAIQACDTDLYLSGSVNFTNNNAYQGGAIKLINSRIYIADMKTQVLIQDNHANDTGGGIYVDRKNRDIFEESRPDTNAQCVYQLPSSTTSNNHYGSEPLIVSLNNSASNGGDHVYGASLHSCCTVHVNTQDDLIVRSYDIEKSMFQLAPDNYSIGHSLVSSNPTRLCFCDRDDFQIDCTTKESIYMELSVTPGEEFSVSVVMVGAYFGRTTGHVYSSISESLSTVSAKLLDNVKSKERVDDIYTCTTLKYSISADSVGPDSRVVMVLTASRNNIDYDYPEKVIDGDIERYHNDTSKCTPLTLLTTNVYLNISLNVCPPGFKLSHKSHKCECNILSDSSNNCTSNNMDSCDDEYGCEIKDGRSYMNRKGNTWVYMYTFTDNETSESAIGIVNDCPFDYCVKSGSNLNLDNTHRDSQCQFDRTEILCGSCSKNFSMILGSSKCWKCNNRYISLIIVFLILGPLLVFFIKIFDFTVQQGTVNGLIFYANVVWIYKSVFFPTTTNEHWTTYFLKVFVAWINLDFGIEACFYHGLNAYVHTWLQFLFPFYIWGIMIIIVVGCRFSQRLTEYFGNNSVPVLATLFLLSFVKLLRTISSVLHITHLDYALEPANSKDVWSIDGNIPYLEKEHAPLFAFAVFVLLFFCVPYTFILLFEQCLVKCAKYRILCWVHKLKPFFDAYFGPLKDRHHYWVGLLLLVRTILVVSFATMPVNKTKISLFLMSISTALLICYSTLNLYTNWMLSLLENVFFANLLILGMSFLFEFSDNDQVQDQVQQWMLRILVGMAFVKFIGIFIFHLWTKQLVKIRRRCQHNYEVIHQIEEPTVPNPVTTHGEIVISEGYNDDSARLRESMLSTTPQ